MTPSQLKAAVEAAGHAPFFFSRDAMRFFGDTMSNYGVRSATVVSNYDLDSKYVEGGIEREVWELYRKRAVKHGLKSSAYFDKETFKKVFERKER